MKKIVLLFFVLMTGITINAAESKANYFVMNSGQVMTCKKILFKADYIKATMENGAVLIIPVEEIKAIRTNKKYYEKMPVYKNNVKTNNEKFMQFVTTRAGLKLYKYTADMNEINGNKVFNNLVNNAECYVVYKGEQFYVAITDKNYPTLFEFFKLPYSER